MHIFRDAYSAVDELSVLHKSRVDSGFNALFVSAMNVAVLTGLLKWPDISADYLTYSAERHKINHVSHF